MENNITTILQQELKVLQSDVINAMQASGIPITRQALEAIKSEVSGTTGNLEGLSYHENLLEEVKDWIRVKGIKVKDNETLQRLAEFFQWCIKKFGQIMSRTEGWSNVYKPTIEVFEQRLSARIAEYYIKHIEEVL